MRSREWRWLAAKEWRELGVSRAAALALVALGPLTGQAFITATRAYAEASGAAGGPAALAQGLSPLDGIIVPVFGAYALAATLLLPFVAIRSIGADKESGAWRLLQQAPVSRGAQVAIRALTLVAWWVASWVPGVIALLWWRGIGGHLAAPELTAVLLGHVLHGVLVIAFACAAAALTANAASAAVVTLAATLGTWALDFVAQVQGGVWQRAAAFTPDAALRVFEHGEVRLALVLVPLLLAAALLSVAAVALDGGASPRTRGTRIAVITVVAAVLCWMAAPLHPSWDLSEDRRSSFSPAVERALRAVPGALRITAYLSPEDPRLTDLQRGVFHKLTRTMADVRVDVVAQTGAGLFERPGSGYGEVWYDLNGKRMMSRSSTEPIVVEQLLQLAGVTMPAADDAAAYTGYPNPRRPAGAAWFYYLCWPLLVLFGTWQLRRRLGGTAN